MARTLTAIVVAALLAGSTAACGASSSGGGGQGAGGGVDAGTGGGTEGGVGEGAAVGPDDASIPESRFVTGVVSFSPTDCAGFGVPSMPGIVEGPPVGGGADKGGTDVVSLGSGGSIVVSFAPNAIVDGPGPDFVVFENPFDIGGSSTNVYAEPGQVSVSDDGTTWTTFPCTPVVDPGATDGTGTAPPYGSCAGWHVVLSSPANGISPLDPSVSGGDVFDLATIGVTHARYVRVVDRTAESCPEAGADKLTTNGFDLDAIAILNAEQP